MDLASHWLFLSVDEALRLAGEAEEPLCGTSVNRRSSARCCSARVYLAQPSQSHRRAGSDRRRACCPRTPARTAGDDARWTARPRRGEARTRRPGRLARRVRSVHPPCSATTVSVSSRSRRSTTGPTAPTWRVIPAAAEAIAAETVPLSIGIGAGRVFAEWAIVASRRLRAFTRSSSPGTRPGGESLAGAVVPVLAGRDPGVQRTTGRRARRPSTCCATSTFPIRQIYPLVGRRERPRGGCRGHERGASRRPCPAGRRAVHRPDRGPWPIPGPAVRPGARPSHRWPWAICMPRAVRRAGRRGQPAADDTGVPGPRAGVPRRGPPPSRGHAGGGAPARRRGDGHRRTTSGRASWSSTSTATGCSADANGIGQVGERRCGAAAASSGGESSSLAAKRTRTSGCQRDRPGGRAPLRSGGGELGR